MCIYREKVREGEGGWWWGEGRGGGGEGELGFTAAGVLITAVVPSMLSTVQALLKGA